jgi:hypothetical protein
MRKTPETEVALTLMRSSSASARYQNGAEKNAYRVWRSRVRECQDPYILTCGSIHYDSRKTTLFDREAVRRRWRLHQQSFLPGVRSLKGMGLSGRRSTNDRDSSRNAKIAAQGCGGG